MSYTPTVWATGDIVSSQKLNKLEEGVANASGMVIAATTSGTTKTLDKTWQEIHDAFTNGVPCVVVDGNNAIAVTVVRTTTLGAENIYEVFTPETYYQADTPSGYPAHSGAPE